MFKSKKKNQENQPQNQSKGKGPVFIIEKDGKAYFKDKKMSIICRPSKLKANPKYPGYLWEFDYNEKLDWFKRMVTLILVNKGQVKFVGMSLDEFNNLGGTPIQLDDIDVIDAKALKKQFKF